MGYCGRNYESKIILWLIVRIDKFIAKLFQLLMDIGKTMNVIILKSAFPGKLRQKEN